jgi:hypothetical protein
VAVRGDICYRHEHSKRKEDNPYLYWFGVNKRNANRRAKQSGNGKFWYVSFEYWVEFCDDTGYLAIKGRHKDAASLDCKINELGYVDGNLKVLTVSDNARKGTKRVIWNYVTNEWDVCPPPLVQNYSESDLPF